MKNILYIVSSFERCGPTNQLHNIINNLDKTKYRVFVITLSKEGDNSRQKDFYRLGLKHFCLNIRPRWNLFSAYLNIRKIINSIKPLIIHSQGVRADFLNSLLGKKYQKISTIRSFPNIDYISAYGFLKGNILIFLHINSLKRINKNCCVSSAVQENLLAKYRISNTYVIHNSVDGNRYKPLNKIKRIDLLSSLNLNPNKKIFIFSAPLIARKNPLFLIEVWKKFFQNFVLIIIGDGPLINECKKNSADFSNILILGNVYSVEKYLGIASYYISPSDGEGFPNSVLEAHSIGLPSVLSNIPPHTEIANFFGEASLNYIASSENSLVEKINEITKKDTSFLRKELRQKCLDFFSPKLMSKKYDDLYDC